MLLLFWDAINTNVRRVMIFFFIFVAVGLGLQFMFASLHTELFAEAIALSGIMIIIENEEGRKDSRTHIYNHAALAYDIKQYIKVRHSFFMICIKMKNPIGLMQLMGNANIETLTELTAEYLSTLVPKYSIYYIGTGTFVIVNENDDRDYNIGIAKAIKERFNHSWHFQDRDTTFNAAVFCAEIPTDLKSYKEISMLINGPIPTEGINEDIIYYGSSLNYVLRRSQVEEAIRNGMEKKNFEVFFQPIYNANDLTICSGEALLRLHDGDIGDIYPDEFLPIAERSGMIFELGDFVLDEVCKFLNSGIPTEMGVEALHVNLSVIQCIQPKYAERIISIVSKYDISPSKIAFEITESAATTDFAALRDFVRRLREKGFRFIVDDYGVGYSNVHSILSLDVDTIKIDRSILWEAEQSEIGRIIMDSSVDMIKRMQKKILITGVETKKQIDLAGEFGVDYLQGYYFSNPISQNEFIGILKATQIAKFEEQKALAASEAMSVFLANMSHEIRTPINAVLGLDEMILRESEDDNIIEYAKNIESAERTLLSLINDILDFSKIEKGNVELNKGEYMLSSMLFDVVNMMKQRAREKGLKFITDIDGDTPEKLYGDEIRIRQIIINLLNNAIKYTDKGSVTLKLGYEKKDSENIKLLIHVKDTGIGIRKEDIGKLYDKFKRFDADKTKTIEGSGLGLAITKQLLNLMDGNINVESEYGVGTTFLVEIPQKILDKKSIGDFESKGTNEKNEGKSRKGHLVAPDADVLVVDDTPMNLMVIRNLLKRTGIKLDEAGSGAECIEKASNKKYDLILLDYRMPNMDGIETLKHLKSDIINTKIPVIALTANAISGSRERFMKEGFDDYVTKPIDGEKLEKVLMFWLPDDKIRWSEQETDIRTDEKDDYKNDDDDFRGIKKDEEINIEEGIRYCGSKESYLEVLNAFKGEIDNRISVIKNALAEKNLKRYTVEVHAIKSSSKIIGADKLSKLAKELEDAGNNNDTGYINSHNDELIKLYEACKKISLDENDNKPDNELDDELWKDALKTLYEFADTMDYDNFKTVLKTIDNYKITDEKADIKGRIEEFFRRLEWDSLKVLIDEYLKRR